MTADKARKRQVRDRMARTGEPYTEAARRCAEDGAPQWGEARGMLSAAFQAQADYCEHNDSAACTDCLADVAIDTIQSWQLTADSESLHTGDWLVPIQGPDGRVTYAVKDDTVTHTPPAKKGWLNPPKYDDPHTDVVVMLGQDNAAALVELLRERAENAEQAGDWDEHRRYAILSTDLDAARQTPAEADAAGLSREAGWHPGNQAVRVFHAMLRNSARWLSETAVAGNAIEVAAAVAWSRGGEDAKRRVLDHAARTVQDVRETDYRWG